MSVFNFDNLDMAKFCSSFSPEKYKQTQGLFYKWIDLPQMLLKLFKKLAACVL